MKNRFHNPKHARLVKTKRDRARFILGVVHWIDIEHAKRCGSYVPFSSSTCFLCQVYSRPYNCPKCPIAKWTGLGGCANTPWQAYNDCKTPRNARREREFLMSFLPEDFRLTKKLCERCREINDKLLRGVRTDIKPIARLC